MVYFYLFQFFHGSTALFLSSALVAHAINAPKTAITFEVVWFDDRATEVADGLSFGVSLSSLLDDSKAFGYVYFCSCAIRIRCIIRNMHLIIFIFQ